MVPPDDIFGVLPIWTGVYLSLIAFFIVLGYVVYRRLIRMVLLGKPENRFDHPLQRLKQAVVIVVGQSKVLQRLSLRDMAGLGHAIIFWSFLAFVFSYTVLIFGDSAWRPFSHTLLSDAGAKVFAMLMDILQVIILVVLAWAVVRRWVVKPRRLRFDLTRAPDSIIIIAAIAGLMILALLTEAFYVAKDSGGPEASVIVGGALGRWFSSLGLSTGVADGLQELMWWLHLLLIYAFGLYIPFSKHMHLIAAPPNAFFHKLVPRGTLRAMPDLETAERFGAGRVQDLTWKELLDGFACAVCGRCSDACPANLTDKLLSPMHIVEGVKDYLLEHAPEVRRGEEPETPLIRGAIPEEALWDCLTCGACMQECPVAIEHVDTIVDMRRYLMMEESSIPETGLNAIKNLEQRGHPWRGTQFTRADWYQGMDIQVLGEMENPQVDILLWIGCTAALEQRSQGMARAAAAVLKRAGVNFGILGPEETCTGDPARRMGHEYLYVTLAQQAIETLNRYGVKKILTICPHCFNTMKNEYPQLGGEFEVLHYTEFVSHLIKEGKIKPVKTIESRMAYHDSCYLGRHNGIYDEPRELAEAVPGVKVLEMEPHCRSRGFCCGAGGGHMWMEESRGGRINHVRTDHFLNTNADTVGVSCPFCLQMMEEGIQSKGVAEQKRARDLLEVLVESLDGDDASAAEEPKERETQPE